MFESHLIPDSNAIIPAQDASKALVNIAAQTPEAALEQLQSSAGGLSNRDADERLEKYGPNTVAHEARSGVIRRFLTLLASPLSLLLLALAAVSFFTGKPGAPSSSRSW